MKSIIVLLIGLTVSSAVFSQTGDSASVSFSLQQAIDYAMQNQKDVKNAVLEEQVAKQKVNEITGLGLPQINTSFDVKDFLQIPTSLIPAEFFGGKPGTFIPVKFGTQYQGTVGADASQLLFSGEYLLGLKAAKVFVELSKKSTERTKIETTALVSKAYYTVLINQERIKLMEANIVRLKKTKEDTKVFLENGFVEKIDYDRLTVTYNSLLVEQDKVRRLLELGTYLLKYQIGMEMNTKLILTDKLETVKLDVAATAAVDKFDYTKRVEYNLFEVQYKLAALDFKRNKVAYLPTAAAYGSINGTAQRENFDIFKIGEKWYPTALIGAKVSLPIFTGLQRNARYQQAKIKVMEAENNMDFIRKSIDLELASTSTMLKNASASLDIQKENITIAEDVARVAKIKYDQGVGSNLELVTAETALKEAQTNYYNAMFDALVAKIDYDKANGNNVIK
ncbi:MAG: TolC family protein [Bacteroidia bacterium]